MPQPHETHSLTKRTHRLNKPWKNFRETEYGRPRRGATMRGTLRPDTIIGVDPPLEEEQPPPVEYSAMTLAQRRQAEVLVDEIATIVALNVSAL